MIVKILDLVGSVTEVAVKVAELATVTVAGALYVAEVVVWPLKVPRPVTVDQFTPALLGSLLTVAVTNCVLLWSSVTGLAGDRPTVIATLMVMLRFPVVAVKPSESVTLTLNVKGPAVVGGPALISPVVAPNVNPPGSAPDAIV